MSKLQMSWQQQKNVQMSGRRNANIQNCWNLLGWLALFLKRLQSIGFRLMIQFLIIIHVSTSKYLILIIHLQQHFNTLWCFSAVLTVRLSGQNHRSLHGWHLTWPLVTAIYSKQYITAQTLTPTKPRITQSHILTFSAKHQSGIISARDWATGAELTQTDFNTEMVMFE